MKVVTGIQGSLIMNSYEFDNALSFNAMNRLPFLVLALNSCGF